MTTQSVALKTESLPTETSAGEIMMNLPLLAQIDMIATRMANSTITIPDHLRGKEGDCWAIAMKAVQWGMNPYDVAGKTHVVSGKLGYEAQLVTAVIQASGAIVGSFRYEYKGEGEELECRVGAVLRGESDITWGEWLKISSVTTRNSPLWKTNQKQQMGYLQSKNWIRLHCPGPILGVYTPDELQDIQPRSERDIGSGSDVRVSSIMDELKPAAQTATSAAEAEDAVVVEDKPRPPKKSRPAPESKPEPEADPLPLAADATYASVMAAINAADSPETIQAAKELMMNFCGIEANEQFQTELGAHYRWKLSELKKPQ